MGNQLAQLQKVQPDHLADIPNLVLKEHLGEALLLPPDRMQYAEQQAMPESTSGWASTAGPCAPQGAVAS